MNSEILINNNTENDIRISEQDFTFRIILKYWKKDSKNTQVSLTTSECETPESFINAIKKKFEIKRFFCLEEIWVLQVRSPQERRIEWVKEINGRIKLHVSDTLKDFLMIRGQQNGTRDFEDPFYDSEE
jgi:hypothetical protein